MGQTIIYLPLDIEKKVKMLRQEWNMAKSDVLLEIVKLYFSEDEPTSNNDKPKESTEQSKVG